MPVVLVQTTQNAVQESHPLSDCQTQKEVADRAGAERHEAFPSDLELTIFTFRREDRPQNRAAMLLSVVQIVDSPKLIEHVRFDIIEPERMDRQERAAEHDNVVLLTSWKSIASYLGVTIRTAQRWEVERGLPVRRLPGPRGVVQASIEELDAWRQSRGVEAEPQPDSIKPPQRWSYRRRLALATISCLFVGVVFAWTSLLMGLEPAGIRILENGFAVTDRGGDQLWHREFDAPLAKQLYNGFERMYAVEDLDGDGSKEVLFAYQPSVAGMGVLICYSNRGEELWRWQQERTLRTASESFAPPYLIRTIALDRHGKETRILVVALHPRFYPARIVLLSSQGKVLGDYMHSGHMADASFRDIDGDGEKEILMAGVSNAYKAATLVVLDPKAMDGSSDETENPSYQILAPHAREKARFILTPSKLSRAGSPFSYASRLDASGQNIFVHVVENARSFAGVIWEFSPDLKPVDVAPSSWYSRECEKIAGRSPADCQAELMQMIASMRTLRR